MDYIIIAAVALIISLAAVYIVKEKRKGTKCIGCPYAKNGGCSSCNSKPQK